jgi:hypothetical protein
MVQRPTRTSRNPAIGTGAEKIRLRDGIRVVLAVVKVHSPGDDTGHHSPQRSTATGNPKRRSTHYLRRRRRRWKAETSHSKVTFAAHPSWSTRLVDVDRCTKYAVSRATGYMRKGLQPLRFR